jgi:hypothetical protein
MSIKALNWAYRQSRGLNSSSKFVLTALADYANEDNCAYPSQETLSSRTLLDPKTVVIALERLDKHGFIQDTGERKGKTGRVKVYHLNVLTPPNSDGLNPTSNPTENGETKSPQKRVIESPVPLTIEPEKKKQLSKFIEFLIEDQRFDGLDVEAEVERALEWCRKKNKSVTERFLESWLLHADQALEEDEPEVGSLVEEPYYSWAGWTEERRRALLELWPGVALPPQRWDKLSPDIKEQIETRIREGWIEPGA